MLGMAKMKFLKLMTLVAGFVFVCLPSRQDVQAYSVHVLAANHAAWAYPMPRQKPKQLCAIKDNDEYLDQKQATAAALGLYFGLQIASPPENNNRQKPVFKNCVG